MSFCLLYNVVLENRIVQNYLGRGLLAAHGLYSRQDCFTLQEDINNDKANCHFMRVTGHQQKYFFTNPYTTKFWNTCIPQNTFSW